MKRLYAIITALLMLSFSASARRQHTVVDSLAVYHESTALNSGKIQQEMIYLHLDNTSYYRDDRIHFACYVVTSGQLKPSDLSRTVYVELLNPSGKVIDHCILKTVDGRCHGSLLVNEVPFYSGYYEIRAYTRYMLSFDQNSIFSRVIPVFHNPERDGDWAERRMLEYGKGELVFNRPRPVKTKAANLKFYPEGGRLVAGLPARVAYEATDGTRRPVKAEGRIIDRSDGSVVATFSSGHMGRGTLGFTPRNHKYRAEVTVDGKRHTYDLPVVATEGITLSVDNLQSADSVRLTVMRTQNSPVKAVGATLTCRNEVCGRVILDLSETNAAVYDFDRAKLPTGIIQLTLFDAAGSPLADRLFFNNNNDFVNLDYSFDKPQYGMMEPVEMKVRMTDARSGAPLSVPFSVSVADADNHVPYGSNIFADLLLSSEIKGYVHNPAWYFQDFSDPGRNRALDCLLMVQGWRRYPWSRLAGMELFSVDSIPEKGIEVHGQVLSRFRNKPEKGANISAMIAKAATDSTEQKTLFLDTYTTDANGRFAFRCYVKGNYLLTLSASKNGELKPYRILLNTAEGPILRGYDVAEMQIPSDTSETMRPPIVESVDSVAQYAIVPTSKGEMGLMLEEIEVIGQSVPWELGQAIENSTASYDIESAHNALLDDGKKFIRTLTDMLPLIDSNFINGWSFSYKGKDVIFVLDRSLGNNASALDEDSDFFDPASLPVETIKNVYVNTDDEVIYEQICRMYPGSGLSELGRIRRRTGCVVYVELYPEMRVKMRPGMRRSTLEGYTETVEFYAPDYTNAVPFDSDYRRTLYWNPEVTPDSTGTATVRFFNNSTARRFDVTTATVAPSGAIGGK